MAQEELQESKLTKAGGRKPTHGCNYPMVGWPSVILTPMGPSLNLTREGTSRPSLRSSLSLSLYLLIAMAIMKCNNNTVPTLCVAHASFQAIPQLQHGLPTPFTLNHLPCLPCLIASNYVLHQPEIYSQVPPHQTPHNKTPLQSDTTFETVPAIEIDTSDSTSNMSTPS